MEETETEDAVHLSGKEVLSLLSRTIVIDVEDEVDEQEERELA